jgi:hypothetical protein
MTRKDYVLIAEVIASLRGEQRDKGAFAHSPSLEEVAGELARALRD